MEFGTGIGGSIRIPAAFNGLYRLRPSAGRLPYEGMANSMDGQNMVVSVVGPLGYSVATVRLMIKSLLNQEPWLHGSLIHDIPWRDQQEKQVLDSIKNQPSRLTFAIMKKDGIVNSQKPIQRAMDIIVQVLKN